MIKDLTIKEFETIVAQRTLIKCLIDRRTREPFQSYLYNQALVAVNYVANTLLNELGIKQEMSCGIRRGKRLYIFHKKTNRIAAEIGLDNEPVGNGKCRRLRIVIMGKGGRNIAGTIGDLAIATAKLGRRQFKPMKGEKHGYYQSKTK
ncbi:hypothetical protein LJC07_04695 [Christensenellaceae bacterium OttesenSCG-928-L17]|nr:hypothetical protein [Christensenellaceae bacterium OttesenSCG-928-L17]